MIKLWYHPPPLLLHAHTIFLVVIMNDLMILNRLARHKNEHKTLGVFVGIPSAPLTIHTRSHVLKSFGIHSRIGNGIGFI